MNPRRERKKRVIKWGLIIVLVLFAKKCITRQYLHEEGEKR